MIFPILLGLSLGYFYHLIFATIITKTYQKDLPNKKIVSTIMNFFIRYGILLLFLGVPLIMLKVHAILFAVTFLSAFIIPIIKKAKIFK